MLENSKDFLNISLAVGFIVLVIFVCFFLFYSVLILRDVSRVVADVQDVVKRVKTTVKEPLYALEYLVSYIRPIVDSLNALREKKVASEEVDEDGEDSEQK